MTTQEMTTTAYLRKQLGEGLTMHEYVREYQKLNQDEKLELHKAAAIEMEATGVRVKRNGN